MKVVGIKVLKDNLSRYLRYVREGENVYVCDRDTVIAEISRPSQTPGRSSDRWNLFLNEEEKKGQLIRAKGWSGRTLDSLARRLPPPKKKIGLQLVLDQIKED